MKSQALFSLKDISKNLKCHLLQSLFGALRVNYPERLSLNRTHLGSYLQLNKCCLNKTN